MKKLSLLLLVVLSVPCTSIARNYDKEYEKLIKTYDIAQTAKDAPDALTFWEEVMYRNERLAILMKAMINNTALIKKAGRNLNSGAYYADMYLNNLYYIHTYDDVLEQLLYDLNAFGKVRLYVADETGEINASTYTDGRIIFERAMLSNSNFTYNMLLGVLAHEYSHYLLEHTLAEHYKVAKRERKNKIIAGIGSAVVAMSAAYATSNGAQTNNVDQTIANLFESAELDKNRFKYRYSREQEIEADIIAYRFLDFIGVGGDEYIKVLRFLRDNYPDYSTDTSDHPSASYRIGLLTYMKAHPEIKRIPPKYVLADDGTIRVLKPKKQ